MKINKNMEEFLNLNVPYTVSSEVVPKTNSFQHFCISCLRQNVIFVNLSNCKHTSFFKLFYESEVEYLNAVVCQYCHYFLKKIDLFKLQIQESLVALKAQIQNAEPLKRLQDLKISKTVGDEITKVNVILKSELSEDENKDDNAQQEHVREIITEVKIEHESCSDIEIDVPLSQIKKEIKKQKKKKKKVKNKVPSQPLKRSVLTNKYGGKIAVITLSKEEMIREREIDANKPTYLRLPYKCEHCITGFDHELTLKDHIEKRHGLRKGGFVCDICKSVLSTKISFKEHTKRHTRRYECQVCGKRNNSVYSVVRHYNEEHGTTDTIETEFNCKDCDFTSASYRSYRYHRDKHKPKERCSLCDSSFVNKGGLRLHMFTVHKQSSRVYSCEECKKVYNAKSGLVAHMASVHSVASSSYCAPCRTHFKSAHNLAHHLKTHSAHISEVDKRFICDECGVKFLTKSSLQQHIDFVHLKRTQHACTKCNKVFMHRSGLKKHVDFVHEKIRPPRNKICDHCGRGFTTLSILQSHVRTHTGERPLQCLNCPATFAHSAALYTHNKLLHNANKVRKS